jgi:DNA-directed RNA polymerase subunit RPC12/RpoP
MPIKLHFWMSIIVPFISFFVGGIAFMRLDKFAPSLIFLMQGLYGYVGFGLFTVGISAFVRFLFQVAIPANCPKCNSRAYRQSGESVIYVCSSCGQRADTEIRIEHTNETD